jgi:hypothetical protein
MRWMAAHHGLLSSWLLRRVVALAQAGAERAARQSRLQSLKQDRALSRTIGFAGRVT